MNKQLLIKRTYYNPSFGFTSLKKLYEKLKVCGVTMQERKKPFETRRNISIALDLKRAKSIFFQSRVFIQIKTFKLI